MFQSKLFCYNCGRYGHLYKKCKEPVISVGIICFRFIQDKIEYLLVRRKYTYNYIELLRAKNEFPDDYINELLQGVTKYEYETLLNHDFDFLWNHLWTIKTSGPYVNDYEKSKRNYENSVFKYIEKIKNEKIEIKIDTDDPEWGFPKGRREHLENNTKCAKREFMEETKLKETDFKIILFNDLEYFIEEFKSLNNINYKHIYYPAIHISENQPYIDEEDMSQIGEVGKIEWKSLEDSKSFLSPRKIRLLEYIEKLIQKKFKLMFEKTDDSKYTLFDILENN